MTSKERLLRTLRGEPVDMVPVEVRYEPSPFNPRHWSYKSSAFVPLIKCMKEESDNIHWWNPGVGEGYFLSDEIRVKKKF